MKKKETAAPSGDDRQEGDATTCAEDQQGVTPLSSAGKVGPECGLGRVGCGPAAPSMKHRKSRQNKQKHLHSQRHLRPSTWIFSSSFGTLRWVRDHPKWCGGFLCQIFCQRCQGPKPVDANDGQPSRWPGVRTIVARNSYIRCIRSLEFTALIGERPEWRGIV